MAWRTLRRLPPVAFRIAGRPALPAAAGVGASAWGSLRGRGAAEGPAGGAVLQGGGLLHAWPAAAVPRRGLFEACVNDAHGRPPFEAGQPTHATHPQLLKEGELTPGIPAAEYAARRAELVRHLPERGAALLAAGPQLFMAGVIPYPYRQQADFYYLTGLTQAGCALLLQRLPGERPDGTVNHQLTLFVPDFNSNTDRWSGWSVNEQAAERDFGAHIARPMRELPQTVARHLQDAGAGALYTVPGQEGGSNVVQVLAAHKQAGGRVEVREAGLQGMLHRLRWTKSANEVKAMHRSAKVSAAAMRAVVAASAPGVSEHTLQCVFEEHIRRAGAARMAYPPVIAGGANGNCIHYSRNDRIVPAGELVTMDAGGELYGYASDITRAWPVSGTYTSVQREVYEAVMEVHQACERKCVPGGTLRDLHAFSVTAICEALKQLGLPSSGYRRFYPHALGHWLGLDTHDTALVGLDTPMQPGNVLTVEPGIYLPDTADIPKEMRGVAIRLEDDIAVTEGGPLVLSADVPLAPDDIAALVGTKAAKV